jgi:hypothetical protein
VSARQITLRRSFVGRIGAALAIAVLLAACSDAPVPTAAPTAAPTPEPTPVSRTYELGTKVWYEGLVITFDRVTSVLDARGGTVDLLVAVANPNADPAELKGAISLAVGDVRILPTRESRIPEVPPSGSVATILTYELQAIPTVDAGTFELGGPPDHVALVPITPAAGEPLSYEPLTFPLAGSATASILKISLRSGLLRWDLPDWFQELNAKLEVLTVTYDVTYTGDFAGGLAFTGDNVALKLPDGTVVQARKDGHSQSVELIGAHKTRKGLFSRFEIPAGTKGKLLLLVRGPDVERAIAFNLGG